MTPEEMETRLKALEVWANREALKRGALGFIAERMIAEQLAAMPQDQSERILNDLTNPYRFSMLVSGPKAADEGFKRTVSEAASKRVEEVVDSIRRRVCELRAEREA